MVRVSSPAKLRPWSELTAKMVMGVVPGLLTNAFGPRGVSFLSPRKGQRRTPKPRNEDKFYLGAEKNQ